MKHVRWILLAALATSTVQCFGTKAPQRSYFVLHAMGNTPVSPQPIRGLVRVRDMDAASVYEKFQIVVRRSPFELQYSEHNVWAVKPNRMVSDVIAQALADGGAFESVGRELGELRPEFILGGDLHAVEVYDSGDVWFAHLAITLSLSRLDTGEPLLTRSFDERKPVPARTFSQGARAISELLGEAAGALVIGLQQLDLPRLAVPVSTGTVIREGEPAEDTPPPDNTIFVPEREPNK